MRRVKLVPYEALNFKQLFQGIYHINKGKAIEKGVVFQYNIDEKVPLHIVSDRNQLNQILMNLVSNAIKFTDSDKKVIMNSRYEGKEIVLEVIDEGIGIQPERAAHVFDAFEQADNSITRNFGGTGLDLPSPKN